MRHLFLVFCFLLSQYVSSPVFSFGRIDADNATIDTIRKFDDNSESTTGKQQKNKKGKKGKHPKSQEVIIHPDDGDIKLELDRTTLEREDSDEEE